MKNLTPEQIANWRRLDPVLNYVSDEQINKFAEFIENRVKEAELNSEIPEVNLKTTAKQTPFNSIGDAFERANI